MVETNSEKNGVRPEQPNAESYHCHLFFYCVAKAVK